MASGGASETGVGEAQPAEAALLVSEFPPPPYYYGRSNLTPPAIPTEALERASKRAAASAAKAKAEAERLRLQLEDEDDKTNAILGGVIDQDEGEGGVVAVFGEIVEVSGDYLLRVQLYKADKSCVIHVHVASIGPSLGSSGGYLRRSH
jgi:hypothetical protein